MYRHRHWLSALFAASLVIALNTHGRTGVWFAPAVVVFVATGIAITALVIARGGTK